MTKRSSITTTLLLAIIPGVAIYWFTQGLPNWLSKTTSVEPASSQSFEGRVIDANTQRLLSGARVVLQLGNVTANDTTDSEGRYLFVTVQLATPVAANIEVDAQGYQVYSLNFDSSAPEPLQDILMEFQPPAPTPGEGSGVPRNPRPLQPKATVAEAPVRPRPQSTTASKSAPALPPVRATSLATSVPYTKRQVTTAVRIGPSK
jgi:hypothetical protein